MIKPSLFVPAFCLAVLSGCSNKPSDKDISKKILLEYACGETATVNGLKVVKTEETESTGGPHIFQCTVQGEVVWPNGCAETGKATSPGTKEKFEKLVVLTKTDDGWQ